MILQLNHVFKDYYRGKEPVPVLRDICLEVEKGEYLAIMGPSGSGKTTLMNLIGCLDVPTRGDYILEGRNIADLSDNALAEVRNKHIGFVFQNFYLLPKMNALDNVALPLLYAGVSQRERRARAKEALEAVGLGDRIKFMPNQLSGGQCQRVAIARAIVSKPDLLLADEPTGALDTVSGIQIMEIFRDLSDQGMTIIMITHEPSIAQCADKTYHILDGQLITNQDQTDDAVDTQDEGQSFGKTTVLNDPRDDDRDFGKTTVLNDPQENDRDFGKTTVLNDPRQPEASEEASAVPAAETNPEEAEEPNEAEA